MPGLDPRIPFEIQAIMAMVEKELAAHNKLNIQVSIAIYLSSPDSSGKFVTNFKCQIYRFPSLSYFSQWNKMVARYQVEAVNLVPIRKKHPKHPLFMILITWMTHTSDISDDWIIVPFWPCILVTFFTFYAL